MSSENIQHNEESLRGDLEFGTIPHLVSKSAQLFPEYLFIEEGEEHISFKSLESKVNEAAKAFMALGIELGDRVGVWAPNMWEWIVGALGVQSAGGVIVPINTRFKGAEAAYVLEKSGAKALITVQGFLGANYVDMLKNCGSNLPLLKDIIVLRGESGEGVIPWEDFLGKGSPVTDHDFEARKHAVTPSHLSDIIFTSGTTGHPKGVKCTHAQSLRTFRDWCETTGLRAQDRYLIVLPFFHSFGYKAGWLSCLMMGATVLPEPVFDAEKALKRIEPDRVSVLPGPPALYQTILARPDLKSYNLSTLRLSVTGAAVIPVDLIHRMRQELSFETIITGYGLTECSGVATMCRTNDDPETIAKTSGRAIPGVEVIIADDDGNKLAPEVPGEILVRGYNVMSGYFADEEQTASAIDKNGWLHTGDIGVMDERGYLRITDRKKDMFIVGGFNAYPAEIESALLQREEIAQAAVVGMKDERLGEVGVAFVVVKANATLEVDELFAWCRENMANYKVPRKIEVLEALPMNASGKIQKFKLREIVEGWSA